MSKSIWQVSVNAYEEILSTTLLFETRHQADEYVNFIKNHPEALYGTTKIDKEAIEKTTFNICPIPLHDNSFITHLETFVESAQKEDET